MESLIILSFSDIGPHTQNFILNERKNRTYNMSMGHVYTVGIVATFSFHAALKKLSFVTSLHRLMSDTLQKSLKEMISISPEIGTLHRIPEEERDHFDFFDLINGHNCEDYKADIRRKIKRHLPLVLEACTMFNNEVDKLENDVCSFSHQGEVFNPPK